MFYTQCSSRSLLFCYSALIFCSLFFFQAEDGIPYIGVTGVQTCALPISSRPPPRPVLHRAARTRRRGGEDGGRSAARPRPREPRDRPAAARGGPPRGGRTGADAARPRDWKGVGSGKSVEPGGLRIIKKKK